MARLAANVEHSLLRFDDEAEQAFHLVVVIVIGLNPLATIGRCALLMLAPGLTHLRKRVGTPTFRFARFPFDGDHSALPEICRGSLDARRTASSRTRASAHAG